MASKPLVLVADDEIRIRRLVSDFLKNGGFDVIGAEDGDEALELFFEKGSAVALVVLDVMMPKTDGWTVLSEIRKISDTPVLLLTARGEDADQLKGFKLGADDYVSKPFSPSILVARVENLLRRRHKLAGLKVSFKNVVIDTDAHTVLVDGADAALTPKEYELLLYLYNNRGMALSREKLLNAVWNYDYFGDVRTVDTHIKQLRAKLCESAEALQTVRGVGYKLVD